MPRQLNNKVDEPKTLQEIKDRISRAMLPYFEDKVFFDASVEEQQQYLSELFEKSSTI
jgi:hypothetical protein